jgi:hypothetical protein
MSQETVKRFNEWATWCQEHYGYARNASPESAKQFLLTLSKGLMECMALTIRDMREIEEGKKAEKTIILPPWYRP